MKKIILYLVIVVLAFSCNDVPVKPSDIQTCDSIQYLLDSTNSMLSDVQYELDSLAQILGNKNTREYFVVIWFTGSKISMILIDYKHYDYVITNMDESRIFQELDRERLKRTCDFIYNNRIRYITIDDYEKKSYPLSKYNIKKIVNFPEMMNDYGK